MKGRSRPILEMFFFRILQTSFTLSLSIYYNKQMFYDLPGIHPNKVKIMFNKNCKLHPVLIKAVAGGRKMAKMINRISATVHRAMSNAMNIRII